MREVNLRGLDLNLLPALDALLRERNVTRAGALAGLSQPAMSRALARLRGTFDDPLLTRVGGRLALTPFAESLRPRLASTLDEVRGVFLRPAFDPAALERTIHVGASDMQTILLAPPILARLRREAPGVDLRMHTIGPDIVRRIEEGDVDCCFALASTPLPPGAHSETVASDRLSLVMRRGHPMVNQVWRLEDYAKVEHATVAFFGDGVSEIDARLAQKGVSRRIALTTPYFMAALAAVAATDLVTTVSEAFANAFADTLGLVLLPPPFADSALEMTMVCGAARAGDATLKWFRALVRDVATGTLGALLAPAP